jgi:hypothetical protein
MMLFCRPSNIISLLWSSADLIPSSLGACGRRMGRRSLPRSNAKRTGKSRFAIFSSRLSECAFLKAWKLLPRVRIGFFVLLISKKI